MTEGLEFLEGVYETVTFQELKGVIIISQPHDGEGSAVTVSYAVDNEGFVLENEILNMIVGLHQVGGGRLTEEGRDANREMASLRLVEFPDVAGDGGSL